MLQNKKVWPGRASFWLEKTPKQQLQSNDDVEESNKIVGGEAQKMANLHKI